MKVPLDSPQVERLLELVSPRVGVVRRLERVMRGADEPVPPILYTALVSNFDFKRAPLLERGAAGKGLTATAAIGGAIGEAVERYCGSHIDRARLHRSLLREAPEGALNPSDLVLYGAEQYRRPGFPHVAPSPEMEFDWVRAIELPDGRETWVPAVAVFLHGNQVMPGDALFTPNSSGLAAGPSQAAAICGGLCELIERDAFLVNWLGRISAPELIPDGAGLELSGIIDHYRCFGVELRLFDLTSDVGIAVVMAVALDQGAGPAAVVGLGCHLDPYQAALRAAFEVAQVRPGEHRRQADRRPLAAADVRGIEDHSAYFAQPEALPELAFLLQTPHRRRLADLPSRRGADAEADLGTCVAALRACGCRVFYTDLTTPDLEDYPIRVVRTLACGLQPIHFGAGMERLGSQRLYQAAARMGVPTPPRAESDLNPCPHPLA